jgi:hypothetical protein
MDGDDGVVAGCMFFVLFSSSLKYFWEYTSRVYSWRQTKSRMVDVVDEKKRTAHPNDYNLDIFVIINQTDIYTLGYCPSWDGLDRFDLIYLVYNGKHSI